MRGRRSSGADEPSASDGGLDEGPGESSGSAAGRSPRPDPARWAVLAIALVQLVLSLHTAWRVGPTYDEHYYATAGVAYWREGRLSFNREHPPLGKWLIGLPLALRSDLVWDEHAVDRVSPPVRFFFQDNAAELDRNLFLVRLPAVLVTVLLGLVLYGTVAGRLGAGAGLVAQTSFAFNPNVLAQGSLAALDGFLMVAFCLAVLAFVRLLEAPGPGRALTAGIAFGAAVLVKYTSLVLIPAFAVLALVVAARRRSWEPPAWTLAVFLAGLSTFAAGYRFETRSVNEALGDPYLATAASTDDAVGRVFTQDVLAGPIRALFGERRPVPLLTALKGLDYQLEATGLGHRSVYRGQPLAAADFKDGNPHPEYYLVVLAIKNALPWLVLVALGAVVLARERRFSVTARWAYLFVPLAVLLLFSTGKALMGARYVLPIFPFLALWAGAAAGRFPRTASLLVAVSAVLALRVHPHYLMYYSLVVGDAGPAISVISDDWGQGVRAMGDFHARHADAIEAAGGLYYEPYTVGDPRAFGLGPARPVPDPQPGGTDEPVVHGIVAVHALAYWRDVRKTTLHERKYAWLDAYEPFTVVDRSVYVYDTRVGPPGNDPGWR